MKKIKSKFSNKKKSEDKTKKDTSAEIVIKNKIDYTPKVSVVIPVYNVEPYLAQCLDSVIHQSLKEIEVICVDDGSTDKSLEILKEYAKKDNRITVVGRENKGVGYTRNQAIKISKGEFIAFMDPDDYYPSENVLSTLYMAAKKNKVKISGGSLIVYDEKLQKEIKRTDLNNFFSQNTLMDYNDFQYDYGYQKFLFDRQMLVKNNIFFPEYKRFQDPPFMVKAFTYAKQFYVVSDYVYAYRYSHKEVVWTEEKVFHLLSGLRDDLDMAIINNFEKLYDLTLNRIKKDYKTIIASQTSDRINQIKKEIMNICLKQVHDRYKNNSKQVKVSVVLPIYNAEHYLRECLDSVINQTLKDIEIICVNDGSTDNSLNIIREYANKDKRIKYIDKPNAGYGQTMNCGIDLACGEYIGIVEPDDFIKLDMYEILYDKASKNRLDITKCNISPFREINGTKRFDTVDYLKDVKKYNKVYTTYELQDYMIHWHCTTTAIYDTNFIRKNNIRYNETPGAAYQDTAFWFKTHCMAKSIMCIDKAGYLYRQGTENQSTANFNQLSSLLYEYQTIYDFIIKNKLHKYIPLYLYKKFKSCLWYYTWSPKNMKKYVIEKMHEQLGDICNIYNDLDLTVYFSDEEKNLLNKFVSQDYKNIFSDDFKYEIIVSLTSYPKRISVINKTIESLLNQTNKADKVILWLAPEQFPNREKDLPQKLLDLCDKGLTIDWYHDIKSYKKLIPALHKYPDAIIVTADDDIIYDKDWLVKLVFAYEKDKSIIWTHRAHRIDTDHLCEYTKWKFCIDETYDASYSNFCTTGGGVLYPPHCFYKDVCKEKKFMKLCPTGDDIWFWAMVVLNGKKIKLVENPNRIIQTVDGTQEDCLWMINRIQNDIQLKKIISKYPKIKKLLGVKNKTKIKPYLLLPYYGLANFWMKVFYIPALKFNKHIKSVIYSHTNRGRTDLLNKNFRQIIDAVRVIKNETNNQIESLKNQITNQQKLFESKILETNKKIDVIQNKITSDNKDLSDKFLEIKDDLNNINSDFENIVNARYDELSDLMQNNLNDVSDNLTNKILGVSKTNTDVFNKMQKELSDAINSRVDFIESKHHELSENISKSIEQQIDNNNRIEKTFINTGKDLEQMLIKIYTMKTNKMSNMLEFRTFGDLAHCIRHNLYKIPNDIDLVVGVPRSGIIPAYIIALFMNKKCCSLDEFIGGINSSNGFRNIMNKPVRNVLVVDDSIHSGHEMSRVREKLSGFKDYNFTYMAVYARSQSANLVDVYLEIIDGSRVWQWNYLNHNFAANACFDMDGVLCVDPTDEQNDDGEKYKHFILNAKPLYIPNYKIRAIVTSRLEKYRDLTENWLKKNGVQYEELVMLDLPTAAERQKPGCHAKFKADVYSRLTDTSIFIESNPDQAKEIATRTGKQVLCVENDELY